jgi:hypothetical protein
MIVQKGFLPEFDRFLSFKSKLQILSARFEILG